MRWEGCFVLFEAFKENLIENWLVLWIQKKARSQQQDSDSHFAEFQSLAVVAVVKPFVFGSELGFDVSYHTPCVFILIRRCFFVAGDQRLESGTFGARLGISVSAKLSR